MDLLCLYQVPLLFDTILLCSLFRSIDDVTIDVIHAITHELTLPIPIRYRYVANERDSAREFTKGAW
jgi:hypothetical protein